MDDPVLIERIGMRVTDDMKATILYFFYGSCE